MPRSPDDPIAKRAALALLASGQATPGQIAEFAGVSRQVVENWAKRAGIDWRRIMRTNLAKAWRRQIGRRKIK